MGPGGIHLAEKSHTLMESVWTHALSVALVQVLIVLPVQPQLSNKANGSCTAV